MRVLSPAVVGVSVQELGAIMPARRAVPSLTVTVPVGVPAVEVTTAVNVTGWPETDGLTEAERVVPVWWKGDP